MENSWKPSGGWVTDLKNKLATDIFTAARFKIVFLYLLMGLVILGAAGYLVYTHILGIIQDLIQLIDQLLQEHATVNQNTAATLITKAINADIAKMNLAIGFWLILTMVIIAYIFAGITLWPIKRAMEKQKRFIGNVSHELKTPLSVMKTNSEVTLLDANQLTHDELVVALKSNLEEIDQMSKITQFLLDFSSLESRLARLEMAPVDLKAVAERVLKSAALLAEKQGVKLTLAVEDDPHVQGNATALEEMVLNLVKNGIAYTPAGGSVKLHIGRRAGAVVLSVEDSGVGIAQKDLPNIFEPFYRGSNAANKTKDTNAGLGLAIVQEIATMHHATIAVKSEVRRGTTFTVRFSALSQFREKLKR